MISAKHIFFVSLLIVLISCKNTDRTESKGEESSTITYELPTGFSSIVPENYRIKYGQKAKTAYSLSSLKESKSTFSHGAKSGEIIGFFEAERLLFLIAEHGRGQEAVKEYYFYNSEGECYYAAVLKTNNNQERFLHTYWMIPENDSIYYEMFQPQSVEPLNLWPLEKPANAYIMNVEEVDGHISPRTFLAFTATPDRAPLISQPSGQMVKKISMGTNETGMDVNTLKAEETVRYQIDLNKRYNYMIAVNPLQSGFMLRGIDNGKIFIENVSTFNWFTDMDNQILEFEIYNPDLKGNETREYRVGVFGEQRF